MLQLHQGGNSHGHSRDFLDPQEASTALLSQRVSLLSAGKADNSLQDVSITHNRGPHYKTSFVVLFLQLPCCWSCLHSLIHRDATPEIAEPMDEEVGWMLADCTTEQPQSRMSVSNGTRW